MPAIKLGTQDDANEINFNNSNTGLAANNVQSAIVEVVTNANTTSNKVGQIDAATKEGWKDLTAEIIVRGNAASAPTWEQMGTTEFYAYNFGVGKEAWATFHVNHDYKPGGMLLIHIHWTTNGTNTQPIKWQIDYTVAKGHNQSSGSTFFESGTQLFLQENCSGTAFKHMVTEMSSSISTTNVEVDALILVHIKRVTNGGTENTDKVYGLTVDLHYEADRFATKNRAPNFYS